MAIQEDGRALGRMAQQAPHLAFGALDVDFSCSADLLHRTGVICGSMLCASLLDAFLAAIR